VSSAELCAGARTGMAVSVIGCLYEGTK
jgi:hypothetical protein